MDRSPSFDDIEGREGNSPPLSSSRVRTPQIDKGTEKNAMGDDAPKEFPRMTSHKNAVLHKNGGWLHKNVRMAGRRFLPNDQGE
jgi:hypothetical protein